MWLLFPDISFQIDELSLETKHLKVQLNIFRVLLSVEHVVTDPGKFWACGGLQAHFPNQAQQSAHFFRATIIPSKCS